MIDLHAHILPGVDDGVATVEEARELARLAAADGVTAIVATPHVREDYRTSPDRMEQGVAELRADFAAERIAVEVLHGGEIDLFELSSISPDSLRRFSIAQTGLYILLEFPYRGWPLSLQSTVHELLLSGVTPVLAHPERNAEVQGKPQLLEPLVQSGALVQITAASLDGRIGRSAQAGAKRLLELGWVHVLASDAHHASLRAAGLTAAARELGDDGLACYLTVDAPGAIVAGQPLPRRPPAPRRRRRLFRR